MKPGIGMKIILLMVTILTSQVLTAQSLFAQDLRSERIWKISSNKRSIFFNKGVFHSDTNAPIQELKSIRNSYISARTYERVVFDFSSAIPPRIYGKISSGEKKVYIDFFNTKLNKQIETVKNVKFVKGIDFFNIDKNHLSIEMSFNEKVSFDIFYLENPGRLVVDVKK